MKRTLALFLTLCMALSMFSFPAFAAEADVAVLDEAALVETETTPAPTEDVVAPVAAAEPTLSFTKSVATLDYKAAAYSASEIATAVGNQATITNGAGGEAIEYSVNSGEWKTSVSDALGSMTLRDVDSTLTVNARATVKEAKLTASCVVKVGPYTLPEAPGTVTVSGDPFMYGNIAKLTADFAGVDDAVMAEMVADGKVSVTMYEDNWADKKAADLTGKAYKELYAVVTLEGDDRWGTTVPAAYQNIEVKVESFNKNTEEAATAAFDATKDYTTPLNDTLKLTADDLLFTGEAAGLGKVDGTLTWYYISAEDAEEAGVAMDDVVWTGADATEGVTAGALPTTTAGTYYVTAAVTSSSYYDKVEVSPVAVEIAAPSAEIEIQYDGKALPQTVVYNGSAVSAFTDKNNNAATWAIEGAEGTVGFNGSNDVRPSLPGKYTVTATNGKEKTDKDYKEDKGSFTIEKADPTVTVTTTDATTLAGVSVAVKVGTADLDAKYYTKSLSAYNAKTKETVTKADATLGAGDWVITASITPVAVEPTEPGYTSNVKVAVINPASGEGTLTVAGTPSKEALTFTPTSSADPKTKTTVYNSALTYSVKDMLKDVTYTVEYDPDTDADDNEVDLTAAEGSTWNFALMYSATNSVTDSDWVAVDSVSKVGYYALAAVYSSNGKELISTGYKTAYEAGAGVQVVPGYVNVAYSNPTVKADGKTDRKGELNASRFTVTDGITGAVVTPTKVEISWKDTEYNDTPTKKGDPMTDMGSYGFTATFTFADGLYADKLNKANSVTYDGDFTLLGANDATAKFTKRDYTVAYSNAALSFTKADLTYSGISSADASVSFVYYERNDKGDFVLTNQSATKDVGVYKVVAVLAPNEDKKTNGSEDSIVVTVTEAVPTIAMSDAEDKDVSFEKGDTVVWPTATVTGVNGSAPTATASIEYRYYLNGELMTHEVEGKEVPYTKDNITLLNAMQEPGVYTVTAQWLNTTKDVNNKDVAEDPNYTASAVVTSKSYTLTAVAGDETKVPAIDEYKVTYGSVKADAELTVEENATQPVDAYAGKFYLASDVTGSVDSMKAFKAKVVFVPDDHSIAPITLKSLKDIKVDKYTFTNDDVKIVGTEVESYTGTPVALTSATVTPKFPADSSYLKVEYLGESSGWTTDITKATRTSSGPVVVRVTDTRKDEDGASYEQADFLGYITIGKTKLSTLVLEDMTRTYTDDGKAFQPKLVIKTEGQKDVVVDSKYVDYYVGAYKAETANVVYDKNNPVNGDLHTGKYVAKAVVKTSALTGVYASYNFGENANGTAIATVTVNPLTLGTLPTEIISKEQTLKFGDTLSTYTIDATTVTTDKHLPIVKDLKNNSKLTGTWDWKTPSATVSNYADYTVEYTLNANGLKALTTGQKAEAIDYVKPTATVNVKIDGAKELDWTGELKVDTKTEYPYGTTLADIAIDASGVVVKENGKTVKGTWVWKDDVSEVLKVGKKTFEVVFRADKNPLDYTVKAKSTDDNVRTFEITVVKGEPTLVVTNTTMAYTGNPASLKIETNNTETEPVLTWYDAKGNTIAGAPTQIGSYKVKVSLKETDSFLAKSVTVDYTITYNQTGIEGFVYRLYAVALGREPDQNGYTMWVNLLKAKEYTPKSVAYGFIFSPEFTNRKYDNATFLNVMYKTFMDREPDASGYAMWLKGLNSGEYTREFVFNGFADSKEFTNICARYGL